MIRPRLGGSAAWRLSTLACVVLASVSCASSETMGDRINPAKPLWFNRPSGAMQVLFQRQLSGSFSPTQLALASSRAVGEPYERGRPEIDVLSGRVFIGSSDHGLYALRAGDGSTIWRFETLNTVRSEPLYDAELDVVYFGSDDGALYCVHASDGQLVWRYASGAEVMRKPVLSGETLYFANGADNLFAIDRRSGKTLWHVHRTPALGMEVSGYAGPALDQGMVFFAFSDGHVAAYDARDGSERWTPVDLSAEAEQAQGETIRYLDVDTTPIPDDLGPQGRVVFVASYAGGAYALDQERGAPVWKNDRVVGVTALALWREAAHGPRPDGHGVVPGEPNVPKRELLLAASGATGLWALDPTNGRAVWRLPIPEGGITAPVPISGALLVGTTRYGAFLLSPLNGRPIDGFDLGTGFSSTPAAFGSRGYMLTNAGTLIGLQVEPPGMPPRAGL